MFAIAAALVAASASAHAESRPEAPNISAESGILVDDETGQILWSREPAQPRPPASLTKILTALVVLERVPLDDQVVMTAEFNRVEGSSFGAADGWSFPVRELLWGMLLQSANDAALALAQKASPDGTVAGFVNLMNERADQLGAQNSQFRNPHGLDEPGHTSSALDLTILTMAAMRNPTFAEIVRTKSHDIAWGDGTVKTFFNLNKMLTQYDGAIGVKNGYTTDSGRSVVSSVQRDSTTLLAVVLGSENQYEDSARLYDWAYKNLRTLRTESNELIHTVRKPAGGPVVIDGLEVVDSSETRPARRQGPPPLVAPVMALLFAISVGVTIRRRRGQVIEEPA